MQDQPKSNKELIIYKPSIMLSLFTWMATLNLKLIIYNLIGAILFITCLTRNSNIQKEHAASGYGTKIEEGYQNGGSPVQNIYVDPIKHVPVSYFLKSLVKDIAANAGYGFLKNRQSIQYSDNLFKSGISVSFQRRQ